LSKFVELIGSQEIFDEIRSTWLRDVEALEKYDVYPATPLQANLVAQSFQEKDSYVMQMKWEITGAVTMDQFQRAVTALKEAHTIFRTRFVPTSAGIYQILTPAADAVIEVSEGNFDEFAAGQLSKGFGPNDAHWFRVGLVKSLESDRFSHFVLTMHHVLYDGWCLQSLLGDLFKALDGEQIRQSPPFKNVVQYVESRDKSEGEKFWKEYLDGWSGPHLFSRVEGSDSPGSFIFHVDQDMDLLAKVASRYHVTVASVSKAAWTLALRTFLQMDDVVFGNVVSGRDMEFPGADR